MINIICFSQHGCFHGPKGRMYELSVLFVPAKVQFYCV